MDNTMIVGLSRQAVLRRQIDVVANNLANINTAGYRGLHMRFSEFPMPGTESGSTGGISMVRDAGALNDMSAGPVKHTGNPLDLSLDGKGWFVVQTPDGERYTRNGSFKLDAGGNLVTPDGHFIQGEGGNMTFGPTERDIAVASDGTISTSEGTKGKLRLVQFENENLLTRGDNTYFIGENPEPAKATVVQGTIEQSNVQAVKEIADMVAITRAYTSLSKLFSDNGEMQSNAINKLGRLEV